MKVSNDYIQQYLKKAHTQTGLYIMAYSTSLACVTIEVLLFFAVVILDVVIYQLTYLSANGFKPFHRGFFCNDPDIMKPWMPERLSFVGIVTGGTVLSVLMVSVLLNARHYFIANRTLVQLDRRPSQLRFRCAFMTANG